jgi:hypothetical protein
MILTDYYKGEKLTDRKTVFDITASTGEYDYFETVLIVKRGINKGGLSFNFGQRPDNWKGSHTDLAITKGVNITTVKRTDIETNIAYGDINNTNDACIILFNPDFKEVGINIVEIFIARGCRNDQIGLMNRFELEDLKQEIEALKKRAVTISVTTT